LAVFIRVSWRFAFLPLLSLAVCCPAAAAQDISRAEVSKWLNTHPAAKPDFKAGDVLSAGDLERLRPEAWCRTLS